MQFTDGEMWIGSMPLAHRVSDLMRDPRCSMHSAPLDKNLVRPDVQIDVVAELAADKEARSLLSDVDDSLDGRVFLLRLRAVRVLRVIGEELHVDSWNPQHGVRIHKITPEGHS